MRRSLIALVTFVLSVVPASAILAVSSVDQQANQPQVTGDPTSNTTARFPTNKQNEPTIAVDPVNGKLIAGSNDEQRQPPCGPGPVRGTTAPANDCSFFPGVGTSGVYTSNDGIGWTNRGLLPGFSDNGGPLVSDGDPVIVFGPKPDGAGAFSFAKGARAYYSTLASFAPGAASGNQAPELLAVSRSDDDGLSWMDPVVAAGGHGFKFNDKEAIWADTNPASPFFGRVYISWTQFRGSIFTFFGEPVMVAFSADGGATWSLPNQLSAAHNNATVGGRQGAAVRTGPDGTVYVFWEDGDNKIGNKMVFASSSDGGVSWTRPNDIAAVRDIADPIPGANFRTDSFLSAAVDQTSGAVYAAWSDATGGTGHIVVTKSTNKGATWSGPRTVSAAVNGYAFFQGLDVAPNGRVHIGYQALIATTTTTYGTGNARIDSYYTRSIDAGATWSVPVRVSSVSSDPAASAQNNLARQFWGDYNTLVATNAAAFFIYTDSRNGVGCPAVDAFQHGVDGSGPATPKPAPPTACAPQFGNTDVFVSKITP
ncbi:MAG TPA: sialidase family protein [Candidatus Limnocylindria bacterium]|jgi:hypothetical protein|nr:sialidase family protein [Candidatus Limnocylindria bacterium]